MIYYESKIKQILFYSWVYKLILIREIFTILIINENDPIMYIPLSLYHKYLQFTYT